MKRIVIVGGGFGGVRAALNLAGRSDFDVTLISKQPYFEYHPALYRSATGKSPFESAINLSDFFAGDENIEVVEDEIIKLDPKARTVSGQSGADYRYDALILALGCITQYFGIKGLAEYSFGIKSVHEALEFKRHLHESLTSDEKAEKNYVVVGGGPTGIELAAELTAYLKHIRKCHGIERHYNIDLVEAAPQLLPSMPKRYGRQVTGRLRRLGVKIYLNTKVMGENVDSLTLPRGEIKSHTVAWTAGVGNNPFFNDHPSLFKFGKGGKVEVNEQLEAMPNVYVIGDNAATEFSGMAQTAMHDANFVTGNLLRALSDKKLLAYEPDRPIYAIPVGPGWAAVKWGWFETYGRLGWWLRRLADLRLYLRFMSPRKAADVFEAGFATSESCDECD